MKSKATLAIKFVVLELSFINSWFAMELKFKFAKTLECTVDKTANVFVCQPSEFTLTLEFGVYETSTICECCGVEFPGFCAVRTRY